MDYNFGGQMMQVVEREKTLDHDHADEQEQQPGINASHVEMLELEIEELTSTLEKERAKFKELEAGWRERNLDPQTEHIGVNLTHVEMLELEIAELASDLEEKRKELGDQEATCAKHLRELEDMSTQLLNCQTNLQEAERKLESAATETEERNNELTSAKQELLQCRQQFEHAGWEKQFEAEAEYASTTVPIAELDSIRQQLDERTCQFIELQERYELLQKNSTTKHLRAQVKSLEAELQNSRAEAIQKSTELDVLRNYYKTVEKRKAQTERETRETEKHLELKISTIGKLTGEKEELEAKVRRIPGLAMQISKLEVAMGKLEAQREASEQEKTKLAQHISALESTNKDLDGANSKLEKKNKKLKDQIQTLETKVSHLEQVRAHIGIVFCVDLSGSLSGDLEQLAKTAFRQIINALLSKTKRNVHIGVVVHASSISIARHMSSVDASTASILDFIPGGGTEDYRAAFVHVVSLLSTFTAENPGAEKCVVMIGDGEDVGSRGDVSTLVAQGVKCHNVVIGKEYGGHFSTLVAGGLGSATSAYSHATGGENLRYDGGSGSVAVLEGAVSDMLFAGCR